MRPSLHIPDDGAIFSVLELGQAAGFSVEQITEALNELITNEALRFPKEVVNSIVAKHDPDTEQVISVWAKTASRNFECKIEYSFKQDAQAWAQDNGYPDGLDSALGGRESCVVSIAAYLLKLLFNGKPCCVVTDDSGPVPGRVSLVEICSKLGVDVLSPIDYVHQHVVPVIEQLPESGAPATPLQPDLDTELSDIDSEPAQADQPAVPPLG